MSIGVEPFEKDFYIEHPAVAALSRREVEAWRRDNRVTVTDENAPNPVRTFIEASFPDFLVAALEGTGFSAPTPIQCQSWPVAVSGRDMIGLASTGSGKTLAFALPAVMHINAQDYLQAGDGPIALMLAPTRELALQIKAECDKFGASSEIKNTAIYGGVPKGPQLRDLQHGVEIAIATPGRLLDFLDAGQTNLRRTTFLVLDEADRMLDLGFEPQLRRVSEMIRPDRQTLMFSATWPREVEQLAKSFIRDAMMIQVNKASELKASDTIAQNFEVCSEQEKHSRFIQILGRVFDGSNRLLIFCDKKRSCETLRQDLKRRGFPVESIHGDKSQQERDWTLRQFKDGSIPILVATDVASRGLDVKELKAVLNYDAPGQAEDYVHRVGRAGRAGAKGESYTMLTPANAAVARDIAAMMDRAGQRVPENLDRLARQSRWGDGGGNRRWKSAR